MREPRLIILLVVLSLFSICSCQTGLDDMLLTNQYLLVGQYGCITQFESQVPAGSCPQMMSDSPNPTKPCSSIAVNMHLIRDPDGKLPPKIGIVYMKKQVYFRIMDINASLIFDENQRSPSGSLTWQVEQDGMQSNTHIFGFLPSPLKSVFTVFDSTSQTFYLLRTSSDSNRDRQMLESIYLGQLFNENARTVSRATVREIHANNLKRFDWSEDAYNKKVYYKEEVDGQIVVFEVPMDRIFVTFMDGKPGKPIRENSNNWKFLSTSGGMFSEKSVRMEDGVQKVDSKIVSISPITRNQSITCSYTSKQTSVPMFNPLVVIRDHDYCLLRYGRDMSREKCTFERNEWLDSRGLLPSTGESILKWLLVTIIVLIMVITLLLVYIYWLRSTFVANEVGLQRNELDQEASLFVAKQRSFASSYPDPALLDVSVDKWN